MSIERNHAAEGIIIFETLAAAVGVVETARYLSAQRQLFASAVQTRTLRFYLLLSEQVRTKNLVVDTGFMDAEIR